jgi:hypothetical protein
MTMFRSPRRVVIRLSDGTEIVTHVFEPLRGPASPQSDTDPPETVCPEGT